MGKSYFLILVIVLLFGVQLNAQVTTSSIYGTVADGENVPLPDATIVATHLPTGTTYGSTTNFDGQVNLRNMRVGGPYTISISYVGFKNQEITNVQLTLGKTFEFNVILQADNQLEEVVLTTTGDNVFGNNRTGAETSVGREAIRTLPTISRSAADFTRLEPSATGNSFGGRNDQFNNFSLDGSIFNNPFGLDSPTPGGQTDAQPISLDAIDQISVSIAPYDVTQAGFTGASVNAVTKSGTNEFHGTVYGFFRNESLTGDKVRGDKIYVPELDQKQYGFSIGGPIVKNKLFFFANLEKDDRTDLGSSWVPNTGSGSINESRVLESDLIAVQGFLSGLGYDTGAYEGFLYGTESLKGIFKLDWNINDKHRVALVYNFLDASKEKPAHPSALGFRGPSASTLQFENAGYQINNKLNSFLLEVNSNFTNNLTNKLQVGYSFFDDFRNPMSTPAPSFTILENGAPYIIAGHEPFSINNKLEQTVFQFTDNLTYFYKKHTFTAGISFEKFKFGNSFNLGAYGARGVFFPTSGSVDEFLNDPTIADDLAAAIAADKSLSEAGEGNVGGFNWYKADLGQFAFYLQDEFQATENIRLTLGIRFDKPMYFDTSKYAQEFIDTQCCYNPNIEYFDPKTGDEVFFDSTEMPTESVLVSPRFGFNWDVKGDNTFQVRGGSGIFSGRFPFVWLGNQVGNPNFFFYQVVDPDFRWPQVWRTNIGLDYKFENNYVVSTDFIYTKDINGAHVQNWGLNRPTGTLNGVDNRPIYTDGDKNSFQNGAYVFTNSNKGRTFNWSAKVEKSWSNDLYASVAYNYLKAQDVNSIEAEITGDAFAGNPALGNVNDDVLARSKYGDDHRFIGVVSKKWRYGNDRWSTTLSSFFEYAQGGRFSYTYGGDINFDGSGLNDLIYIPTSEEVEQMNFSQPGMATAFDAFISQDDYLKERRGKYAERYAAISPWRGRIDVKLLQDYNFNIGDKVQTVQFSVDILNFGNMLNSDWGVIQQPNSIQPIGVNVDPDTKVPTYSFDGNLQKTFGYDASLLSRWQMQFGLRYIF
ncbi:TonB-dependent receptor [Namhaeicola litoreus]|uniref:Carboxypeptidase regulatory-like domain-containing protein n=1 Tax=Namhaeicola litoreus TaxID=1052145 RepID=A0ABW3Y4I2_9FLAO